MSIFEYDQEKHMRQEREQAWEEGREAGMEDKLLEQIRKKLKKGKTIPQIAEELEEEETAIREIVEKL